MPTVNLWVTLPRETVRRVDALAVRMGTSRSEVMRRLIERGLAQEEQTRKGHHPRHSGADTAE